MNIYEIKKVSNLRGFENGAYIEVILNNDNVITIYHDLRWEQHYLYFKEGEKKGDVLSCFSFDHYMIGKSKNDPEFEKDFIIGFHKATYHEYLAFHLAFNDKSYKFIKTLKKLYDLSSESE